MRFGPVAAADAEGGLLVHALPVGGSIWRKGRQISASDIVALREAGVRQVLVALPAAGDLTEDAAAGAIAAALRFDRVEARTPATGRVNLHATRDGVFTVDKALVDAVNAVDPAVTLATLPPFAAVVRGQMVATVKIIPFAVPAAVLASVTDLNTNRTAFAVHPFRPHRVGLVQTRLPGLKPSVLDKTRRVTEVRLARSGSGIVGEIRVGHDAAAVAGAIGMLLEQADMVVVFGASAVSDGEDVIPAATRLAGGEVERVGMPVDPGNLLVLGRVGATPVIGAPGCARSPKENGFDWVLDRITAGLDITSRDIAGLGVGGLLTEIPTRPEPREASRRKAEAKVHAVVLAAGRSSRMGGSNKLMAKFDGKPLLYLVTERVLASKAAGAVVVTGHQSERSEGALVGLSVKVAHNPDYTSGLASSLQTGIAALPASAAGALVVLGDMPGVGTADLNRMIDAFEAAGGSAVVRATAGGKRGNPVILPRELFAEVATLEGDTGARHLVEKSAVIDVELGEGAALDVDTPEMLAHAGGTPQG